jgi:hypothetical protein
MANLREAVLRFWSKLWPKLDGWTRWVRLSRIRNSFLARAVTALSMSSLVLSNLPAFIQRSGIDLFSLRLVFTGSLVFLIGYVLFAFCAPAEFNQAGEVHDHVKRMSDLADAEFIRSRLRLASGLAARMKARTGMKPPEALIHLLEAKITELTGREITLQDNEPAGLFHADLTLRDHDAPGYRLIVAGAMLVGGLCLLYPTARNVLRAIF